MSFGFENSHSAFKNQESLKPYEKFDALKEKTGLDISCVEDEELGIITVSLNQRLLPGQNMDVSSKSIPVEFPLDQKQKAAAFYKEACEELKSSAIFKKDVITASLVTFFENQNYPTNPETGKQYTKDEVKKIREHFFQLAKENHFEFTMVLFGLQEIVKELNNAEMGTEALEKVKSDPQYAEYPKEEIPKLFKLISNLAEEEKDRLNYLKSRGEINL